MTNVVPMPDKGRSVAIDFSDPVAVYLDSEIFGQLQRVAKLMSSASLAPQHLRGEGKLGDCFLVAAQAFRWRMDPFAVAQHTYVVQGKLGYEGKLIAAIVNASGRLDGSLSYSYSGTGDERAVIVSGKLSSDGEIRTVEGRLANWRTSNEQWKKQPDQMLAYRGAREWARRHMPEAVLGIHAEDDFAPSNVVMKDVTPGASASAVDAILSGPAPNHIQVADEKTPPESLAIKASQESGGNGDPSTESRARPVSTGGNPGGDNVNAGKAEASTPGASDPRESMSPEERDRVEREADRMQRGEDDDEGAAELAVDLSAVAVPMKGDKPDIAAYAAAVNAALAKVEAMTDLAEFDAANKPVATKIGGALLANYNLAVAQRRKSLGGARIGPRILDQVIVM